MKNLILIGLIIISIASHSQNSIIDWKSDLEFLNNELPQRHYNFNELDNSEDFGNEINQIIKQVEKLTDFEIAVKVQQNIAKLGDSHTNIQLSKYIDKNEILPLHLFWFKDGVFILHTTENYKEILGQKIVAINETPIQTIIDSLSTIVTVDNDAIVKSNIPKLIPLVQLLKYFGFVETSKTSLTLENDKGETNLVLIQPTFMDRNNRVMFIPDSLALCYKNERTFFVDYELEKEHLLYFQYNKCWSRENPPPGYRGDLNKLPSFNDFQNNIIEKLKDDSIDKLIVDLRFNSGGNSSQGTELIEKIATISRINQKGKIYVILGRFTFSSAIINAMDFKSMTKAIFVGENTGGKPNHFGEVRNFTLPSSNLTINYSTKYFRRVNEDLKTLTPDFAIETTFEDFKKGIDPVYEWIIEK
jgi:hypothetical protein